MNLANLKKIRIYVSLVFFVLTLLLFVDFNFHLAERFSEEILFLQFIPSLLSFSTLITFSAIGFILVIVLTLLLGRVYCSTICPLGTLQDLISFLTKKISKSKSYKPIPDYRKTKYLILSLTVLLFLSGLITGVLLLDPYSNFGRISAHLVKPILILSNNGLSSLFEVFSVYLFYPHEIKTINIPVTIYSFGFLIALIFFVVRFGRIFCNTLCPVGVFLGIISNFSFVKISIDKEHCSSCNSCTRVCKAGCIDKSEKELDFSRCVSCYNCFTVCPSGGISFKTSLKEKFYSVGNKSSRRKLIKKVVTLSALISAISYAQNKIVPKSRNKVAVNRQNVVTPPGAINTNHFNTLCTSCHLCVSACPTQVLQPSIMEFGLVGLFQPFMDYKTSFCNYECKICSDVCPTGAITKTSLVEKKLTQIGVAKFIKENCIVETENTECGACSEHCPTKAVHMIPYKKITIPEVREEYCIGCGACEYACPTIPYKSIYVEGNRFHKKAVLPIEEKIDSNIDTHDFPF